MTFLDSVIIFCKVNENFKYYRSKNLNQKYAVHKQTGKIHFKDGVIYTPNEMEKLQDCNEQDIKNVHLVKKMFEGIVI